MENRLLAIFDLDGVLINSKQLHFDALNLALRKIDEKYVINSKENSIKFDGLSTRRKLEILREERGLDTKYFDEIWDLKQKITLDMLTSVKLDDELQSYLNYLSDKNIYIALASNSIRSSIDSILDNLGISKYFNLILSNEDVKISKPYPAIYWKAMTYFGVLPENTFIFEDSYVGRLAAQRSGARLIPVDSRHDLTWDKIRKVGELTDQKPRVSTKWKSNSLNVLIPMAGLGSRFESAGYTFPKPLIDINGKPMIQIVVENLNIDARFIYIVRSDHFKKFNLDYLLRLITPNCEIIQIDKPTDGAACTTLLAKEFIDNSDSLLIANSDQFIDWNSGETIYSFMASEVDGGIVTFESSHPKWSFVKVDDEGFVLEVAEKKPISNLATVGVYFWKTGSDYVKYAEEMIEKDIRTNGEFYVCPVYNQAINDNKKIRTKSVTKMWGLGTPEDLKYFLENNINI